MAKRLLYPVGEEPDPDKFGVAVSHWGPGGPGPGRVHYVWVYRWFQLGLARLFGGAVYHDQEETAWLEVKAMEADPINAQVICQRCYPDHPTDMVPRYDRHQGELPAVIVPVVVEDIS